MDSAGLPGLAEQKDGGQSVKAVHYASRCCPAPPAGITQAFAHSALNHHLQWHPGSGLYSAPKAACTCCAF